MFTEYQIERRIELMMDTLDRQFMRGDFDQKSYDSAVRDLDKWAKAQYAAAGRNRRGQ